MAKTVVYEKLDYSLRPTKNVERKLLIQALRVVTNVLVDTPYRYIGMGSLWFVDFALVHRHLRIGSEMGDMVSIEKSNAARAAFNAPFSCVQVVEGDTATVLPTLDLSRKAIVWLDHEKGIDGSILSDLDVLARALPTGSIIIATIHAGKTALTAGTEDSEVALEQTLRDIAGDLVPPRVSRDALTAAGLPRLLADILRTKLHHTLMAHSSPLRFMQLFNCRYRDSAPMLTYGGILVDEDDQARVPWSLLDPLDIVVKEHETQLAIKVPILTAKEKAALDRILPCKPTLEADALQTKYGFRLDQDDLNGYHRFYREYPVFAEWAQ